MGSCKQESKPRTKKEGPGQRTHPAATARIIHTTKVRTSEEEQNEQEGRKMKDGGKEIKKEDGTKGKSMQ